MKDFFNNKITMIVESVLLVAGTVGLVIGGVSSEGVAQISQLAIGALSAIDALITAIYAIVKKD